MISAKDLMIGDWVKLSKGNWSENRQVELTDIEMIVESVYLAEPIPITPEILEKNFPTYEWLAWGPSDMLDTIPAFTIRIDEDYAHIEIDLRYVHELQHALRLCGIEKEITI